MVGKLSCMAAWHACKRLNQTSGLKRLIPAAPQSVGNFSRLSCHTDAYFILQKLFTFELKIRVYVSFPYLLSSNRSVKWDQNMGFSFSCRRKHLDEGKKSQFSSVSIQSTAQFLFCKVGKTSFQQSFCSWKYVACLLNQAGDACSFWSINQTNSYILFRLLSSVVSRGQSFQGQTERVAL